MDAKQDFDRASRLVKQEVARFELERIEDFRDSLQAFLSGMIDRQKEVCSAQFLTVREELIYFQADCGMGNVSTNLA
jgi:Vps5 C terminal like